MMLLNHLELVEDAPSLSFLDGDISVTVETCLSTGARWSEVQKLTHSQVLNDRINLINTKNGKKINIIIISFLCWNVSY